MPTVVELSTRARYRPWLGCWPLFSSGPVRLPAEIHPNVACARTAERVERSMTSTVPEVAKPPTHEVFSSLEGVCRGTGLDSLAGRLVELRTWLADDLDDVERAVRAA